MNHGNYNVGRLLKVHPFEDDKTILSTTSIFKCHMCLSISQSSSHYSARLPWSENIVDLLFP